MGKKITVHFEREKVTKNKQRFSEVDTKVIDKLYVAKDTDEELGNPAHLSVTLEAE